MKYPKGQSAKRLAALYLALNDSLVSPEEIAAIERYEAQEAVGTGVTYTSEEVKEYLALRCAGRFRTKRFRKKHGDVLIALRRAQLKLQRGSNAT